MYNNFKTQNTFRRNVDLNNLIRDIYTDVTEWQPVVKKISSEDIKKFEKKEERKIRYVQRKK
jgi:hypothetical protein